MKSILGKEAIQADAADLLSDESRFTLGIPAELYFPQTSDDVVRIVRHAHAVSKPITIIGGQTGIAGGCVPTEGSIAIHFGKMNRVSGFDLSDPDHPVMICEPGITLDAIEQVLSRNNCTGGFFDQPIPFAPKAWFYAPDPTEMTAQLGGSVATNASGARSFYFGPTRNHIHSLEIVLADGRTATLVRSGQRINPSGGTLRLDDGSMVDIPSLHTTSPAVKNAAGYYTAPDMDLVDLFIGSEGTLGIITRIGIRLTASPGIIAGLSFFHSRNDAFDFADWLRPQPEILAIEYFDTTALDLIQNNKDSISLSLPDLPQGCTCAVYWEYNESADHPFEERFDQWEETLNRCSSSFETTWSGSTEQERARLRSFRHAVPELVNARIARIKAQCPAIRKIGTDAAVPATTFRTYIESCSEILCRNDIHHVIFGHLGDYHLHINMLPVTSAQLETSLAIYHQFMQSAIEIGGTVSAEHGIGKLKREYLQLMYGSSAITRMQAVKAALDPHWQLNPQNLFLKP